MRIGVGEAEVNQLDVVAVVGQHDVGRLEVSVDNLLGVQVGQGVAGLVDDFGSQFLADPSPRQQRVQRAAVHPLHLDAVAQRRNVHEGVVLADVRVAQ